MIAWVHNKPKEELYHQYRIRLVEKIRPACAIDLMTSDVNSSAVALTAVVPVAG